MSLDGRVNNALLNPTTKREKEYEVEVNRVPSDEVIAQLARGVKITTTAQRDGKAKEVTRATLPCLVSRIGAVFYYR